ncbi:MAG TPA: FMN-binding negative transcriptional regulator [Chitinophagales bacterium]|nr:FMN-binding negative transcriptional regulator [Chitinophagales bacterium]
MYIPKFYEEKDLEQIEQLIRQHAFGILITTREERPFATHLPLHLVISANGEWLLQGHIARANPQWRGFDDKANVLAVFMGPHSYVSPSWYNHKNVPTWNYQAVHLSGKIRIVEGTELRNNLRQLMAHHENLHAKNPTAFDEVPEDLLQKDLNGLVGFEIKVERIEAASKLSQNRDAESYQNIIDNLKVLKAYDSDIIAAEMEKKKEK